LDIGARTLAPKGTATVGKLQSFLTWDAPHRLLYAADEADGMLRKIPVDASTWALGTPAGIQTAGHPVFVTTSKDGSVALVAHYNEGSVQSFPVTSTGFGTAASSDSPGAQAHAIVLSDDQRFAFVPCKGSDLVARYSFDSASGTLTALAPPVKTQANDGPRHLAWTPDEKEAFVVDEISSTVNAYSYDGHGNLTQIDRITTLASGFSGTNTAAEILVHPSGKVVYATNRVAGKDGDVVAFRIGTDGHLTLIGHQSTGGPTPRSAALDPTGSVLLAGNQDATTIALFSVNGQTGALSAANVVNVGKGPYFVGAAPLPE
jgi:6-phosphogluconolactonase